MNWNLDSIQATLQLGIQKKREYREAVFHAVLVCAGGFMNQVGQLWYPLLNISRLFVFLIASSLISFLDAVHLGSIFKREAGSRYLDTWLCFTHLSSSGPLFSPEVILFSFCLNVISILQIIFSV